MKAFIQEHRVLLSLFLAAGLFLIARPTPESLLSGLPLVILGEGIRTWASGYIRKNDELATGGPYAFSRNPLYLGSFLMGLGFVFMTSLFWVVSAYLAAFFVIYRMTIRREEETLLRKFGPAFEAYRVEVPCFLPCRPFPPKGSSAGGFDWGLVKKHREYRTWLGAAAGVLLMIGKMSFA